jgi:formylglycine-generating enzyme required for sulfatase activity
MPLGSSAGLKVRDTVVAIGHPPASDWSVTEGRVTALRGGEILFSGDAVDAGNSGGPLLDAAGRMVGLIKEEEGKFGVAVMIDVIRPIVDRWVGALEVASTPPGPADAQPAPPARVLPSPPPASPPTVTPPPAATPPPAGPPSVIRGKDGKEMVLVPAGTFTMGSSEAEIEAAGELAKRVYSDSAGRWWFSHEGPLHPVWLDAFYIDRQEVTVKEYRAFQQATGYRAPGEVAQYAPADNHPVVEVSWEDAAAYCRWAGKKLPTEAQWEKAARGTDGRRYPWGNEPADGRRANYCDRNCGAEWKDTSQDDGYEYTAPVGHYPAGRSPYGVDDMAGNVWEWVRDCLTSDYYSRSAVQNPVNEGCGKGDVRVIRGGGYWVHPIYLRAAGRVWPTGAIAGFRCVVERAAPRD